MKLIPLNLRRVLALNVDLAALAVLVVALSTLLTDGGPPVDTMAFFSPQDFNNYFILVTACLVLSALRLVPVPGTTFTLSIGDTIFRLTLLRLDGTPLTFISRLKRWLWGLLPLTLVLLPGPIISLLLGVIVANLTHGVFTTPADIMDRAGFPGWLAYTLHGLSFAALAAAVFYLALIPAARLSEKPGEHDPRTPLDHRSGTTHFSGDAKSSA